MNFEKFFQFISYAAVFGGFFSLWVSGTFGVVGTALFVAVIIAAWFLEGSRWQISEKLGTVLIVLSLPAFYLGWRYQFFAFSSSETAIAGILARMILSLTAIKLLQKKSDRDWIFLYLMSFFEVLLAAGLSISALYLVSFLVYLLVMVCAIIAFEIRKTSRFVHERIDANAAATDGDPDPLSALTIRRLPTAALSLIVFIVLLALPMFFTLPRVGGAGLGGNQNGLSTSSGFSDSVKLGGIGRIQQNDEVVMRVRLEGEPPGPEGLYFRGVALDRFDNQSWSKSKGGFKEPHIRGDRELIQFDYPSGKENLSKQTIYLEPLDTPVLFALPRIVAMQGNFSVLYRDSYGSVSYQPDRERISYKVLSDRSRPSVDKLRADNQAYSMETSSYLSLPLEYDRRIADLATQIAGNAPSRFDKAAAIEAYLQGNYGYTLEQKAGGEQPLADFLFNVREGHCEYFATAMAVMLRTQGVATRIVNGFHGGEYNDTADITVVRQRHAHAWVEVYFPKENAWVTFDPTPFSDQPAGGWTFGIAGQVSKYLEALETYWIQYFVAFDNQEQASLARTFRRGLNEYQNSTSTYLSQAQAVLAEWWSEVRGDKGTQTSLAAIGYAAAYIVAGVTGLLLLVWLFRKLVRLRVWSRLWERLFRKRRASIVEFYDRMLRILAMRGYVRQPHVTPLEFALEVGLPEAVEITEKYNRVRFGDRSLDQDEVQNIERLLKKLVQKPA